VFLVILRFSGLRWSGRRDSDPGPPAPKAGETVRVIALRRNPRWKSFSSRLRERVRLPPNASARGSSG